MGLALAPGELHGLVGQNGSGKSTLVKILTGIHAPDAGGRIEVDGVGLSAPVRVPEMREVGMSVVHQSLGLIEEASVLENVRAGRFGRSRWLRRIDWAQEREQVSEVLARLGQTIDLHTQVSDLSAEDRATVAITRAFQDHHAGRGLIIFDESTRALTAEGLNRFYRLVEGVRQAGAAVLLISHRLEEVLAACDRVTVLRDGHVTAAGTRCAELDEPALVRLMIGRNLREVHRRSRRGAPAAEHPAARVHGLSGRLVRDVSVAVRRGEIVGVTGLVGSGFEELPYLLAGATPATGGELRIGADRTFALAELRRPLATLRHAGVALVPERRAQEGLALDQNMLENMTLPRLRANGSPWWSGQGWQREETMAMIDRLGITPRRPEATLATLSGGNQQKVLLGKWLGCSPRVLLLHEPTQAVDVAARADIIEAIRAAADGGCAVIVAGTDPQELVALCDRVLVLRDGRVRAELTGEFDEDAIVHATFERGGEGIGLAGPGAGGPLGPRRPGL
jgi:ribose transport system ATP-binding protein